MADNGPVYVFNAAGAPNGQTEIMYHAPGFVRFMALRRKKHWLVFELAHPCLNPIPEKVLFRAWAKGQDGLAFPTLTAARTFLALGGTIL